MPAKDRFPLLANSLVVGVTGHRNLRVEDVPGLQARIRAVLTGLQSRNPGLPLVLLSPLAQGSDQLVAQVALDLGLRVIAPLPLPLELYREDFLPADLEMLERQLSQVETLPLPLEQGNTLESVSTRGSARDRQYAQAGVFVSDRKSVV